jgi:hypothetical protein
MSYPSFIASFLSFAYLRQYSSKCSQYSLAKFSFAYLPASSMYFLHNGKAVQKSSLTQSLIGTPCSAREVKKAETMLPKYPIGL